MSKRREDEDAGVGFDRLADLPEAFEAAGRTPPAAAPARSTRRRGAKKVAGRRGPDPDPDSLRSKVTEGAARFLKVALPTRMHKRLHVMSVEQDRTVSDLVAEALEAHYNLKR